MPPKNNRPQNDAQKRVEGALDFNSRRVAAVREYRECEAAKEPNLSDEKAKWKEDREERNKYKKMIEEAKSFSKRCALQRFWHRRRSTRHWRPKGCQNQSDPPSPVVGKYAQSHGSV